MGGLRGRIRRALAPAAIVVAGSVLIAAPEPLDAAAEAWVARTFASLTPDEKVGQLLVTTFQSAYTSSDSDEFERLSALVDEGLVGGLHVFGSTEPAPPVLLNPAYGTVILGDPLAAASLFNRLQARAKVPLLNTADFEAGAGFRLKGTTAFPRAMAFGAAGDETLAYEAGRITAVESRALGVHVNFAPVVDVNNNPRNPVINTRSFGEDPARVAALASAYARGLQDGGMLATLKHFPGHGDTDVDTHLGLAVIGHDRARLDAVELAPFRLGVGAGADAVMVGHISMPAIDTGAGVPATWSPRIVGDLLRRDLGFDGLVYTDSMSMDAVTALEPPGRAAVRAVKAGNDVVLHSPDDRAAFAAIREAIERGEIDRTQADESVRRILRAKARLRLHEGARIALDEIPTIVGTRAHRRVADEVSQRAVTLVRDARGQVPLRLAPGSRVLYLSMLDYPSGWRIAAPSRTFVPELDRRWPGVTAIELSDRSTRNEIDLVRTMARRFDAIVAGVFVRTGAFSGRMDLAPPLVQLLRDLARASEPAAQPLVAVFFGSPYVPTFVPELPAMLLTYDFYDGAEAAAVRALAGEAPIAGRLPVELPGLFPLGHGLDRPVP